MSSVLYIVCAGRVSVTTPAKEGRGRWTAPGYYAFSSRSFRGMFTYICHDAYQSSGNSPRVDHSFHAAGVRLHLVYVPDAGCIHRWNYELYLAGSTFIL